MIFLKEAICENLQQVKSKWLQLSEELISEYISSYIISDCKYNKASDSNSNNSTEY